MQAQIKTLTSKMYHDGLMKRSPQLLEISSSDKSDEEIEMLMQEVRLDITIGTDAQSEYIGYYIDCTKDYIKSLCQ
ncbi:hypothetical protein [Escherichia phage vB_EcoM_JNE01]|nr:hypothetical protein [Escherichia phage vB_EcoM_JNE01]